VLHEPFLSPPSDAGWRQNTDPFVFGPRIIYSNCRQLRNRKLRSLAWGSVVLFGSRVAGEFVLDTLLVVGDSQNFEVLGTDLSGLSAAEWECVAEPLQLDPNLEGRRFRRYEGTLRSESPDSLFSFVPCLPWNVEGSPFRRPVIRLDPRWITPGLAQAAKATPATDAELAILWREVREQVEAQDLCLAVNLETPAAGN
jgi:hypothetical protein